MATGLLSPIGLILQAFTDQGVVAAGYKVYTYVAGTSTPVITYTDSTLTVPNSNPIVFQSNGRFNNVSVWAPSGTIIKQVLTDPNGVVITGGTIDNLPLINDALVSNFVRTAAEISASITPLQTQYPELNVLRYMTTAQITSILGNGLTDSTSGFVSALAVAAVRGGLIFAPAGNYVVSSTLTLPQSVHIMGSTRRGFGTPPTGLGTGINAAFAGPVFQAAPGVLTAYDVLIEGMNINGNKGTYGAGNGVVANLAAGVTIRCCVVANFGTNNIVLTGAGAYGLVCDQVYSAQAGNANFYIDGSDSWITRCESDAGVYSIYGTANSSNLRVVGGGHFEGASNTHLYSLGSRLKCEAELFRITLNNAVGAYLGGTEAGFVGNEIFGSTSTTGNLGLDVPNGATEYRILGNRITAGDKAARLAEGGLFDGNVVEAGRAGSTGLELLNPPNQIGTIGPNNSINGVLNSILYTSGTGRWRVKATDLANGSGTFLPINVVGGFPEMEGRYIGTTPTVASAAALSLPYGSTLFFISGVTAITSMNASGWDNAGPITLIFQGILTFTDGSNLKLAGNFVTTADDTITLVSDGTNWYEVCRSIN